MNPAAPSTMAKVVRQSDRPRRKIFTPAKVGIYLFLISAALFFMLPLYVMGITSIKPMSEIRMGNIFAFPVAVTFEPWAQAWSSACTVRSTR